jgi:hypothetical protein
VSAERVSSASAPLIGRERAVGIDFALKAIEKFAAGRLGAGTTVGRSAP